MKINFYKGDLPASFKATNIIALDSETMGLNPKRDKLCLVQISNGDEVCHLVKIDLSTQKPLNLIKILKNMGEKSKISIRNIRREANEDLKKKLKDKKISEDENNNFEKNIQKLTDTNIQNLEKILSDKEKEILQI